MARLPETCALIHPTFEKPILITCGRTGYQILPADFDVAAFNEEQGIGKQHSTAMWAGSRFGFQVAAANPDLYRSFDLGDDQDKTPILS